MVSTPLRPSSAATANTPTHLEPWSRSTTDRFGGYGSQYAKEAGTPRPKTPSAKRTSATTPGVDRYAAPNERTTTPSKPKLNAAFASTTDRFTLPGSHVAVTVAPGVGTYQPSEQAARVRGAVKLQAAIRRRQSRMFTQPALEMLAPFESTTPVKAAGGATSAFAKPTTHAGERFAGGSSIYGSSTPGTATPGAGAYNPALPSVGELAAIGGRSAAFKGSDDRFARHDSIYPPPVADSESGHEAQLHEAGTAFAHHAAFAPSAFGGAVDRFAGPGTIYRAAAGADAPGVGEYEVVLPKDGAEGTGAKATFASTTDRFDMPGSHLAMSAAPGVGTYKLPPSSASIADSLMMPHEDSTFVSTTDRFALPGSHVVPTAAPGVGTYEPSDELQAARVLGAVKLQAAVRRRQSRGIFAQVEAHAVTVPGPGAYKPVPQPAAKAEAPIDMTPPDAADAAPQPPPLRQIVESLTHESMPTQLFELEAVAEAPTSPATPAREEAPPAEKAAGYVQRFSFNAEELACSPVVREPPKGVRLSNVVSLDMWLAESDEEEEPEEPKETQEKPSEAPDQSSRRPTLVRSGSTTAWGPLEPEAADSERLSMASIMSDAADGDWLFSQLSRMMSDAEIAKEDYYSEEDGWDLDGLREDLGLYMRQAKVVDIC